MRFLKLVFGVVGIYILFFVGFSPISGCKKDVVHDTTIKIVRDTTIIHDSIYDLKDGLVAYYDFNGGSLNDASGYNNNIVFNNAISTTDRLGLANNAYSFNGADNYMRVPHSPTLNLDNITIFAIVKINGFSKANCHINSIVSKGTPEVKETPEAANGFISLSIQDQFPCESLVDSTHEFFVGIFGDNIPPGAAPSAASDSVHVQKDQWYIVALSFDGIWTKMYINGELKAAHQDAFTYHHNTNDLFIGRHEDDTVPYWFNGVIDEVRVYNRSLPAGAIKELSNLKN